MWDLTIACNAKHKHHKRSGARNDDDTDCSDVMCECLACVSGSETPNTSSCLPRRFGARNFKMISVAMLSCGQHLVRMCAVNNAAVLGGQGGGRCERVCKQRSRHQPKLRPYSGCGRTQNVSITAMCDCFMSHQKNSGDIIDLFLHVQRRIQTHTNSRMNHAQ